MHPFPIGIMDKKYRLFTFYPKEDFSAGRQIFFNSFFVHYGLALQEAFNGMREGRVREGADRRKE